MKVHLAADMDLIENALMVLDGVVPGVREVEFHAHLQGPHTVVISATHDSRRPECLHEVSIEIESATYRVDTEDDDFWNYRRAVSVAAAIVGKLAYADAMAEARKLGTRPYERP